MTKIVARPSTVRKAITSAEGYMSKLRRQEQTSQVIQETQFQEKFISKIRRVLETGISQPLEPETVDWQIKCFLEENA